MSRKVSLTPPDPDQVEMDSGVEGENHETAGDEKGETCSWRRDSLPTDFKSVSKPSQVVQNLLQKKQYMHEAILREMQRDLIAIQEKCRDEFQKLAVKLKSEIDELRGNIQRVQEVFEIDIKRFNAAERDMVDDRLTALLAVEESLINKFHEEIWKNEKKRTALVRKAFQKFGRKLKYIAYVPPGSLEMPTDVEIKAYNEKIRKNNVIYGQLCSTLHLSTSNLKSEIHDWLEEIKIFKA